jgi:hypothetical protein
MGFEYSLSEGIFMSGPRDEDLDLDEELTEDYISADQWGNEWDSTGDLSDIDFRLVDE